MTNVRKTIVKQVMEFLEEQFPKGIQMFDNRNWAGDEMANIYSFSGVSIDYAICYDYVEIFGLTDSEFSLVDEWWNDSFGNEINKDWREELEKIGEVE